MGIMKNNLQNCAAFNCPNRKTTQKLNLTFFRFPKNENQCKIWCQKINRKDLLDEAINNLHKKYYLCSKHFTDDQFLKSARKTQKYRLISNAIPSPLNVSSDTNLLSPNLEASLNPLLFCNSEDNDSLNKSKRITRRVTKNQLMKAKNGLNLIRKTIKTTNKSGSSILPEKSFGLNKEVELPYLQVYIENGDKNRKSSLFNKVTYKYRDINGSVIDIDLNFPLRKKDFNNEEDFNFEENGKTLTIKRTSINEYRIENDYYGPLKVITEESPCGSDVLPRLEPLDFTLMRKDNQSISEQEVGSFMKIIPSCQPSSYNNDDHAIFLHNGKPFKVLKEALILFKERAGVEGHLELKSVKKLFKASEQNAGLMPITVLTIGPKKTCGRGRIPSFKKKKKTLGFKHKDSLHPYSINYVNWAKRGSACFSDINKVGINFIEEILGEKTFCEQQNSPDDSLVSLLEKEEPHLQPVFSESSFPAGSKQHNDEIWSFLCHLIKENETLIEFQYEVDDHKWIEVKRIFNTILVNGETVPDLVLKVESQKNENQQYSLTYYLKCFGRLVQMGSLNSKSNILNILNLFSKERYVCLGLAKEKFFQQVDENERLRTYLKENTHLIAHPFQSLYSRKCKMIVRDFEPLENYKFQRGSKTICAPLIVCKPCEVLSDKLEHLLDPMLSVSTQIENARTPTQRYGPVQAIKVNRNIKKLCTETVLEFVSNAQREEENLKRLKFESEVVSKRPKIDADSDSSEEESLDSSITEREFVNMLSIKPSADSRGNSCTKCGFQAKSLLDLFEHVGRHLFGTQDECHVCKTKFFSRQMLIHHQKQIHSEELSVCSICQQVAPTREDYFHHMSSHRPSKPFVCAYCDQRHQTLELYKKHMKDVHFMGTLKEMNFKCKMCQMYFYTEDHLFIHKVNADHFGKVTFECKICNFPFSSVAGFGSHVLEHNCKQREDHNLAACPECKYVFFDSYQLEDHTRLEHINANSKQTAPSAVFESDKNSANKSVKGFACNKCLKVYVTLSALEKHSESSHAAESIEGQMQAASNVAYVPSCNICGMKFASEYFLSSHMNLHVSNKSIFPCDDLSYMYNKRSLDQTIRSDHHKQEQMLHHQQMNVYNQPFVPQQQATFVDGNVPSQPPIIQGPHPDDANWSHQPIPSELDGAPDSVYNLLHL